MVVNETLVNSSSIAEGVYHLIEPQIAPLVKIFTAVGIAVLVWLIFIIIRSILRIRMYSRIKRMEQKLDKVLSILEKKSGKDSSSGNKIKK